MIKAALPDANITIRDLRAMATIMLPKSWSESFRGKSRVSATPDAFIRRCRQYWARIARPCSSDQRTRIEENRKQFYE